MDQKKLMNEIIIGIVYGLLLIMLFSNPVSADLLKLIEVPTPGINIGADTTNLPCGSALDPTGTNIISLLNDSDICSVSPGRLRAASNHGVIKMAIYVNNTVFTQDMNVTAYGGMANMYSRTNGNNAIIRYELGYYDPTGQPGNFVGWFNSTNASTTSSGANQNIPLDFGGKNNTLPANMKLAVRVWADGNGATRVGFWSNNDTNGWNSSLIVNIVPAQIPSTYIPPAPSNLASSQDNFWINYTWQAGSPGNITDSFNVSVNNLWTNGTTQTFNKTTVGPHGTSTIIVYAYNASAGGALSLTSVTDSKTLPNNPVTITNTSDRTVNEGGAVYVDYDRTDADGDTATFSSNRTDLFTDFNTATGQGTWVTDFNDAGTYYVDFGVSDGYGSISNYTMAITVNDVPQAYIPPTPTIIDILQGNFWINYTWQAGSPENVTDSYNVSVNDFWTNGTTETFNLSNVGAHGWSNITIYAFNNSGGGSLSSTPATNNTQVANNVPVQTLSDNFAVTAGNMLTFTVSVTEADDDVLINSTNATKGTFNQSTGVFSWMPSSADTASPYFWWFRSDDGYGGIATNTTTITVTDVTGIYINGTVRSSGNPVKDVRVSTNTSANTTTDENGFYSLPVTGGTYELTASLEPVYYTSSPVTVVVETGVVVQDIDLLIKPAGTISGSVRNA